MKRGLWLTLMVIVAIASVVWWNRIEIALTAINLVSAPDVAPHRAVNWQQDLTDKVGSIRWSHPPTKRHSYPGRRSRLQRYLNLWRRCCRWPGSNTRH